MTEFPIPGDQCQVCEHAMNEHKLLAGEDPMKGGIVRCPVEGCDCHATFSPEGVEPPSDELIESLSYEWALNREAYID